MFKIERRVARETSSPNRPVRNAKQSADVPGAHWLYLALGSGAAKNEPDCAAPEVTPGVAAELTESSGRGAPLPEAERAFFEPRMGSSLAGVRVHSDSRAAGLADALGARAFTYGHDIYLGAGRGVSPASSDRQLLAHELAHVAEQPAAGGSVIRRQPDPNVDYFPHKTLAKKVNAILTADKVDTKALFQALESLDRKAEKVEKLEEAYKSMFNKELDAALAAVLTGDDLAHARFLLHSPPPKPERADVTVDKEGKEEHKAKVAGGEVSFHKDVEYTTTFGKTKSTEGFSVGYEGSESKEARFIQFLWGEVIVTKQGKAPEAVPGTYITVSGSVELTTDPKTAPPKRIVDSGSAPTPFYEDAGPDVRTAKGTAIFDRPATFAGAIDKQFDDGATQVVERDHFDDYLIVGYKTVYRVSLIVEWTYTSRTKFTRVTKFDSGEAVKGLPSEVKAALVKQYPKFEYIQ